MNEWEWQLLEDKPALDRVTVDGVEFSIGDRVRLRPRSGGDIMDLALAGKIGIIESIEQDYEGKNHGVFHRLPNSRSMSASLSST